MHFHKNILLIAGTGRNSGKTSVACEIIKKFSRKFPVTGIKVSPHFHGGNPILKILKVNSNYKLYQETSMISNKDTSRMLKSGAQKVYYIETKDHNLRNAFEALLEFIPENIPVVCESPALINWIKPGIFVLVDNHLVTQKKQFDSIVKERVDIFIEFEKGKKYDQLNRVEFIEGGWKFHDEKINLRVQKE